MTAVPFAGCGIIDNRTNGHRPFSLHYGIIGTVRIAQRLQLTLELSSMNTFKDFDGLGNPGQFGDQLMNVSAGLTYSIGKKSNSRLVDAAPYQEQNERLIYLYNQLSNENKGLSIAIQEREKVLAQYRYILSLEGLLDRYGIPSADSSVTRTYGYAYNSYNGLTSLRERLKKGHDKDSSDSWNDKDGSVHGLPQIIGDGSSRELSGETELTSSTEITLPTELDNLEDITNGDEWRTYLNLLSDRKTCLGSPILFFFALGTTRLTDQSHQENIRELAKIVSKYGLHVKVTGAADSATGTEEINNGLSSKRSDYITEELLSLGVKPEQIKRMSVGGINRYNPSAANRNTRVEIYL